LNRYLLAFLICAGMALLEGVCAGRDPMAQLRRLRQPLWSPPSFAWILIGLSWYAICFTALVRLLPAFDQHPTSVCLLIGLMALNAGANVPQVRMRRLDIAFLYLLPYWVVLSAFIWSIRNVDSVTLALFGIYSAYQLYAAAWGWNLWQMNKLAE
jgi:tryptophan-rich sensory protein